MADPLKPTTSPLAARAIPKGPAAAFHAGLRAYMLAVYNYMASGLLLTGIVALFVVNSTGVRAVFFTASGAPTLLGWIAVFAPLALVFTLSFGINRLSERTVKTLFWTYAILMGVSLSTIFLAYTGVSVARTFFVAAAAFGGLSLWGYTTKRNLSAFGTFLIMGVVGLLIAMIVNMFLRSSALDLIVSAVGVLLFAGLTAFDTQKIKSVYFEVAGSEFHGKAVVMGALTLYLDFINLFLFLLRFMGDRRQ
ncbi:membrane protein [Sphingobium sp. Ant17]|nr:membrane protein [Sphingobium sp. Ant17]|tara:strand:- start:984 stop:1733 length:750 start_codon:yes stop_codon:yes gene_type:complete